MGVCRYSTSVEGADGKVCAFFGHREIWADISKPLEQAVRTAISEYGAAVFWVGGYGHFDSCATGAVRKLQREYPHIQLKLILAYLPTGHDPLSNSYDQTIYPEGLELVPRRYAISRRNRWIVSNCDILITYVNHAYGGAHAAYKLAKKAGRTIMNLGCLE